MARTNTKTKTDHRLDTERLAGGYGARAAKQDAEALLRRAVLANLLWEDTAYQNGEDIASTIRTLVPKVPAEVVADLALEARTQQRLRHVPLLLTRECARHSTHRHVVAELLPQVIRRADELAEFMAIYWRDGKQPLANSVRKGLAAAFDNFDAYQFAKYNRDGDVKLRDVMFLVHPEPKSDAQTELFRQIAENTLATPDTWEVALSTGADKRETWERLILDNKLGALAFLRNLRNMEQAKVPAEVIRHGFANLKTDWLLPLNFFGAAHAAPRWQSEIEKAMFASLAQMPKLSGLTHFVVDVSGSMGSTISSRSQFTRLDAAAAMAVMAREVCEDVIVWATSGDDWARKHKTMMLKPHRGFALADEVRGASRSLGLGGIFTRQCLDFIRESTDEYGERTIIFSDSQDCDHYNARVPRPFSPRNYIVDVSNHTRGINYDGVWTAEISGWSEQFIRYIQAYEEFSS